jgi:hypothetical protein
LLLDLSAQTQSLLFHQARLLGSLQARSLGLVSLALLRRLSRFACDAFGFSRSERHTCRLLLGQALLLGLVRHTLSLSLIALGARACLGVGGALLGKPFVNLLPQSLTFVQNQLLICSRLWHHSGSQRWRRRRRSRRRCRIGHHNNRRLLVHCNSGIAALIVGGGVCQRQLHCNLSTPRKRSTGLGSFATGDFLLALLIGSLALEPPRRRFRLFEQRRRRHALDIHLERSLLRRLWHLFDNVGHSRRSRRLGDNRCLGILRAHSLGQLTCRSFGLVATLRLLACHSLLGDALLGGDALHLGLALSLGLLDLHFGAHFGSDALALTLLLLATRALRIGARLLGLALGSFALGALLVLGRQHARFLGEHGRIESLELGGASRLGRLSLLLRLGRRRSRRRRLCGGEATRNFGTARLFDATRLVCGCTRRSGTLLFGELDAQRSRLFGGALVVGGALRLGSLLRLCRSLRIFGTLGLGDALGLFCTLSVLSTLLIRGALGGLCLLGILNALGIGTLSSRESLGLVLFGTTLVLDSARLISARLLLCQSRLISAPLIRQLARGFEPSLSRIAPPRLVRSLLGSNGLRLLLRTGLVCNARLLVRAQRAASALVVGAPPCLALFQQTSMGFGSCRLFNKCTFAGQRALSTTLIFTRLARFFGFFTVARSGTKNT